MAYRIEAALWAKHQRHDAASDACANKRQNESLKIAMGLTASSTASRGYAARSAASRRSDRSGASMSLDDALYGDNTATLVK